MRRHQSPSAWSWVRRSAIGLLAICCPVLLGACAGDRPGEAILASGFIEAEETLIAPEVGGRIAEVPVDEGDEVVTGQVLVRLDDALLQTERAEALAGVTAAEANLARLEAGARPAERTAARAALSQAQAQQQGAEQALENALQTLDDPQELNAQIVEAETQVALAEQAAEMARAERDETEFLYDFYREQGGRVEDTWSLQLAAAQAALAAAEADLEGARRYRDALYAIRANPLTLMAEAHAAEAQARAAEAVVDEARAALDEIEAGPTPEERALAQAQLHQAEAVLGLADARLTQLTLTSPITGIISSRTAQAGETAAPGITLLTLANLDQATLVVYIPENQIGRIQVGQSVDVTVDSFPDQVFTGYITTIAGEAEFTPRSVQTREERVNLVFAVKVVIPNPEHALKPGMPADAVIRP